MDRVDGSDEIYLIGCSRSVLDLTAADRERINRARCVLALNKFVYFRRIAGIMPTHVWFAEDHPPCPRILDDILADCRRNRLRNLTFILSRFYRFGLRQGGVRYAMAYVRRAIRRNRKAYWRLTHGPAGCHYEFVRRHDWMTGGSWAKSLDEPLYNLKTGFTSALNYLAIRYPGSTIQLVGTDFNTPGYFFEEEMRRLQLPWDDWSSAMQAEQGTHSAAIAYGGSTVFDGFPFIKEQLERSGIELTCNNPHSETVLQGLATYAPIGSTREVPGMIGI